MIANPLRILRVSNFEMHLYFDVLKLYALSYSYIDIFTSFAFELEVRIHVSHDSASHVRRILQIYKVATVLLYKNGPLNLCVIQ
jgi:hypothetical protein